MQLDDAPGNRVVSALLAQLVAEPAGGQVADAEPGGLGILVWTMTSRLACPTTSCNVFQMKKACPKSTMARRIGSG